MGPVLLLFSAACFGAMGVFGKLAYEAGVAPGALLLLRFTMAAALLGVLVGHRPDAWSGRPVGTEPSGSARSRWTVPSTALGLGALGYATPSSLYFAALERIGASLVALVLYTYPVFVTVAAGVLGRDRLTAARCAALAVTSGGTLLVLLGAGGLGIDLLGVTLALSATVTYTVYVLVADSVVHRLPPLVLSAWVMTGRLSPSPPGPW